MKATSFLYFFLFILLSACGGGKGSRGGSGQTSSSSWLIPGSENSSSTGPHKDLVYATRLTDGGTHVPFCYDNSPFALPVGSGLSSTLECQNPKEPLKSLLASGKQAIIQGFDLYLEGQSVSSVTAAEVTMAEIGFDASGNLIAGDFNEGTGQMTVGKTVTKNLVDNCIVGVGGCVSTCNSSAPGGAGLPFNSAKPYLISGLYIDAQDTPMGGLFQKPRVRMARVYARALMQNSSRSFDFNPPLNTPAVTDVFGADTKDASKYPTPLVTRTANARKTGESADSMVYIPFRLNDSDLAAVPDAKNRVVVAYCIKGGMLWTLTHLFKPTLK